MSSAVSEPDTWIPPSWKDRVQKSTTWILLFMVHISLDMFNSIDALPSTNTAHLFINEVEDNYHWDYFPSHSLKAHPLSAGQKGDNGRSAWPWLSTTSLLFPWHNSTKKLSSLSLPARIICQVFSEIEMMEESGHGTNLQNQPSQPYSCFCQFSPFLYRPLFTFLASFSLCLLSSQCHFSSIKASKTLPPTAPATWLWLQGTSRCWGGSLHYISVSWCFISKVT